MDATERRRLLFEKITANSQRRNREELLSRIPPYISDVLSSSPCIYSIETDPILRRFFPFTSSGLGSSGFTPANYYYAEVAWENKMLALLPRLIVPKLAGQGYLLVQPPADTHCAGQNFYLSSLPLFVVEFRWAVPLLKDLLAYCDGGLGLVEQDLRAGALIDIFSGILPEDPNPWEIGYEVALWPVQSDELAD